MSSTRGLALSRLTASTRRPTESVTAARAGRGGAVWHEAGRRLAKNRLAVAGAAGIVLVCLTAIFADVLAPYPPAEAHFDHVYEPPSWRFPLGTDQLGRDALSRIIHGSRVSMGVALGVQALVVLIGLPLGMLAGYAGGRLDLCMTRLIDIVGVFPSLLFAIFLMSVLGAGLANVFLALAITGWPGIARQARAQVLVLKRTEFVEAALVLGASHWRLLTRHVLANALTPIIVSVAFGVPHTIFAEAALSFVGVGISPPTPSWGQMVGEHQQYLRSYWHLSVLPSVAIALVMLSFTFFGDGIRDALDPKTRGRG